MRKRLIIGAMLAAAALVANGDARGNSVLLNGDFSQPTEIPGGFSSNVLPDWSPSTSGPYGNYNITGQPTFPGGTGYAGYTNGPLLFQDAGALLPNSIYVLNVSIGSRSDFPGSGEAYLFNSTTADFSHLITDTGTVTPTAGTFVTESLQFNTQSTASGDITVGLGLIDSNQADFQNATFTVSSAPLPTAAWGGAALLGSMGLLKFRRRWAVAAI